MKLLSKAEMTLLESRLKELKKTLPRVTYSEFLERVGGIDTSNPYLVNIRGANGTGKSTVPLLITLTDPDILLVTGEDGETYGKEILTYSPQYNLVILGRYYTKTGGLDISLYQDKMIIERVLRAVWADTRLNILMEGIVCSSTYGFYAELFKELEKTNTPREVLIINLVMELEELEKRIMVRNGGRQINMKHVAGKQATVKRNIVKFERDGFNSWTTSNHGIPYPDMIDWFMKEVSSRRVSLNI